MYNKNIIIRNYFSLKSGSILCSTIYSNYISLQSKMIWQILGDSGRFKVSENGNNEQPEATVSWDRYIESQELFN